MKTSNSKKAAFPFSLAATLALMCGVAPLLAGCGASPDEDMDVKYPAAGTIGSSDQEPMGIAPGAAVNSAQAQQAADDAYARGYAAGQNGDAPDQGVGGAEGDQGSLAVGEDGSQYSDSDPSALTDFRTTLDPYGTWVEDPNYGTIWVPSSSVVGSDFTPYVSAGHWTYDSDYVWVSDYDWGWAPFHYGRWIQTGNGWGWIPGRRYAGAWVSWRTGYDGYGYLGWAPLAPSWYWRGGFAYGLYSVPPAYYSYCPNNRVFTPGFGGAVVGGAGAQGIAAHTRPYVSAAPSANSGRIGASPTVNNGLASRGPAPQSLGYTAAQVPHAGTNVGLARAQGFARPQSAQTFGAHAPASINNPAYAHGALPSHSSLAPIATGPRYVGSTNNGPSRMQYPSRPIQSYSRPSSFSSQPSYQRPAPNTYRAPSTFNSGSHFSSGSSFTPHSSFSSGSSFHSSPSFSSPSFHSAAPSYHPSSHPSFSGGGGGGHGRR